MCIVLSHKVCHIIKPRYLSYWKLCPRGLSPKAEFMPRFLINLCEVGSTVIAYSAVAILKCKSDHVTSLLNLFSDSTYLLKTLHFLFTTYFFPLLCVSTPPRIRLCRGRTSDSAHAPFISRLPVNSQFRYGFLNWGHKLLFATVRLYTEHRIYQSLLQLPMESCMSSSGSA